MFISKINRKLMQFRGRLFRYNIHVDNNVDSLDLILKNQSLSVVRFGDGEFDIINGKSIPYQIYDKDLAKRMKKIILNGSNSKLLVCLPDIFKKMGRYNKYCKNFYYGNFFYQNRKILKEIEKNKVYGSTFISRPYIDLKDKRRSKVYFEKLRQVWENKDILIIEGKYSRSGEGNNLFSNANSVSRIICPSKNAFFSLKKIEESIKIHATNKLILLMLGPAAKIIIDDLHCQLNNQMIDLGHIDSEYEWFLMGAKSKIKKPHKHTAEFNYDDNKVKLLANNSFNEQVVDQI